MALAQKGRQTAGSANARVGGGPRRRAGGFGARLVAVTRSGRVLAAAAFLAPSLAAALALSMPEGTPLLFAVVAVLLGLGLLSALSLWRRIDTMKRLADATASFAPPARSGAARGLAQSDDTARLTAGVSGLLDAYEAARRRADPARLEDPLTGVPNRLAATRRARDEISRARRAARPLSVALIELSFEGADPTARQRMFRLGSELLLQTLRAYDQIGRWREDVFVTVMPEAEIEHAVGAARRIRDRLLADAAMQPDGVTLAVRAGVAVLQPDDATLLDIADRADRALDRARERGAGRIESAPGPRTRPGRLVTV